jgi:hypothetical protein
MQIAPLSSENMGTMGILAAKGGSQQQAESLGLKPPADKMLVALFSCL